MSIGRYVGYSPRFLTYVLIHGIDTFFQKLRTTVSTKMPPYDMWPPPPPRHITYHHSHLISDLKSTSHHELAPPPPDDDDILLLIVLRLWDTHVTGSTTSIARSRPYHDPERDSTTSLSPSCHRTGVPRCHTDSSAILFLLFIELFHQHQQQQQQQ